MINLINITAAIIIITIIIITTAAASTPKSCLTLRTTSEDFSWRYCICFHSSIMNSLDGEILSSIMGLLLF